MARVPVGPRGRARRRRARGYLVAVGAWAVALAARLALDAVFESNPFFTPFYPAVLLAVWVGGLGPGLLAVGLSVASGAPLWMQAGGGPEGAERWLYVLGAAATLMLLVAVIELLHRERRRSEATRRLERRRAAQLAEAGRRREELVAMLAHELRNPLHALLATVKLLPGEWSEEDLQRLRRVVETQAGRMRRVLDELLDAASVSRGRASLRLERLDLGAVLDRALQAADVEGRGRTLHVSRPTRELALDGDPDRLEQAFFNLLDNAVKFTEPGGHVELALREEGERAVVEVRDDGRGVSRSFGDRAFDLFAQDTMGSDRSEGGLGVGLYLVRWVVEGHGGRVELESEGEGLGATVRVELRLRRRPASARPLPAAARAQPGARRVLIVDDDPDSAWSLARLLERDGHETATAPAAGAALECCASFWPEVVISDIGLPGKDGFELAREIRRRAWPEPPLLIALTGYGDPETRERARASGFRHHLLKPVRLDELRRILERELDGAGRRETG
jgi:signal transduction histidine kinase/ActR/RegA family two-component response regulator